MGSIEKWLHTLDLRVRVEALNATNLSRLTQLFNKTNQMNLSTRRMTGKELLDWGRAEDRQVLAFFVSDRFGDSGLTGILGVEAENGRTRITDFILSCRVMGRKVEETMLYVATKWAKSMTTLTVEATYIPTSKNKPCCDFFQRSDFRYNGNNTFIWDATQEYPLHPAVRLLQKQDDYT